MVFGRRNHETVTRTTKPTLMTRLRGRHANKRTVKTTTEVHPHGHTTHHGPNTTTNHVGATRRNNRSSWHGRTRGTAAGTAPRRKTSIGDKISGAMMKLRGSLTHRPGVKAAGTRRMHGTDGRGSHRV